MPNSKRSLQFYYDTKKDSDIEDRLRKLAEDRFDFSLSISQIAKIFMLEKVKDEEQKIQRREQRRLERSRKSGKVKYLKGKESS